MSTSRQRWQELVAPVLAGECKAPEKPVVECRVCGAEVRSDAWNKRQVVCRDCRAVNA